MESYIGELGGRPARPRRFVDAEQVEGKPHKWSFLRDGEEKGVIDVVVDGTDLKNVQAEVKVGMKDLLGRRSPSPLRLPSDTHSVEDGRIGFRRLPYVREHDFAS